MKELEPGAMIARIARVFADDTRVRIVLLLSRDRMATMDICTRLGVPQPRVSSHLSILLAHGLVTVDAQGRQRIYTLSSRKVGSIMENFTALATPGRIPRSVAAQRQVEMNSSIRKCRTCYDHLAGVAGVELLQEMVRSRWLCKKSDKYSLSQSGSRALLRRGVNLDRALRSKRTLAYGCMDWTERTPHLGGSLGAAVLNSLISQGMVERIKGTRAMEQVKPVSKWIKASDDLN